MEEIMTNSVMDIIRLLNEGNILPMQKDQEAKITVRRHIVVGANRILFSVYPPTRLCRIGTYRRFKAERPHTVVVLFQGQISCF